MRKVKGEQPAGSQAPMILSQKNLERPGEEEEEEEGKSSLWTLFDDEKLSQAVELYTDPSRLKRKRIDWDAVSNYMDGSRTPKQCYSRWTTTAMHSLDGRKMGAWDSEDDAKLMEEVEKQKRNNNMKVSWQAVSKNVNLQRNRKQCMARYNNVLQFQTCNTKKVGCWDAAEDTKLIEAVEMFRGKGRKNGVSWRDVVEQLNNTRSQKQCKKRWDDAFADVYKSRVASASAVSSSNETNREKTETTPTTAVELTKPFIPPPQGGCSYGNYCSNQSLCTYSFSSSGSSGSNSSDSSAISTSNSTSYKKQEYYFAINQGKEKEDINQVKEEKKAKDIQWQQSSSLWSAEKEKEDILAAGSSLLNLSGCAEGDDDSEKKK